MEIETVEVLQPGANWMNVSNINKIHRYLKEGFSILELYVNGGGSITCKLVRQKTILTETQKTD